MTEPEFSISNVPPDAVAAVWSELQPLIKKALSHGQGDGTSSEHMLVGILRRQLSLWVVHRDEHVVAGMVVSVKQYPTGRKLFVELLVGTDMEQWVDQLERVLIECRDLVGAMCIEASCRIGLAKKLGKRGWSKKAIVMELT